MVYFQPPSLLIAIFLGTFDALLCVSHALQSALESLQEERIVLYMLGSLWLLKVLWRMYLTVSIKLTKARYGGWLSD